MVADQSTESQTDEGLKSASSLGAETWTLADVVDFEFLLRQDTESNPAQIEARDHQIFLDLAEETGGKDAAVPERSRREIFRGWLETRRRAEADRCVLPGEIYQVTFRLLWMALGVLGLGLGISAAAGLLRYDGAQPINVAGFFGFLVLVQVGLLFVAGLTIVLRRLGLLAAEFSFFGGLIRGAWRWVAHQWLRHVGEHASGEVRSTTRAFIGSIATNRSLYGGVMIWPLASLLQWFGVLFNVGILSASILLVTFSDRAFGWQSAVEFDPARVHYLVQSVAAPWSLVFPEGRGYPTLEEIQGSQIVLKDGIRELVTEDLVSWWPFLCFSVAVYGLLPRIGLLGASGYFGKRALLRLNFSHVVCDRLFERMTRGTFETAGVTETKSSDDDHLADIDISVEQPSGETRPLAPDEAVLFIEPELREGIDFQALNEVVGQRFQKKIGACVLVNPVTMGTDAFWARLPSFHWTKSESNLILLQEAWQPPIAESAKFLKSLRGAFGAQAKIIVGLVGKPDGQNFITPVKGQDRTSWVRRIAAMADPMLRVEELVNHER